MKKNILLLDIDFTVINTDSMIEFIIYSLKKKTLKTIIHIPYILTMIGLYILKIVSLKKAKEAIFITIKYFSEEDLELFFKKHILNKINKSIKNIIEKSKHEKIVIMITASPYAYMKYFEKYGYAEKVIGTELLYKQNKYTNKIIGKNCKGKEKVERIKAYLKYKNIEINYENSSAYSDSKSDMPMLSLVKNAFLVSKKDGQVKELVNTLELAKI